MTEGVDHPGIPEERLGDSVWTIGVNMTVKVIGWFKHFDKPAKGIDTLMSQVFSIMDASRRGMRNKNIQIASFQQLVSEDSGQ